VLYRLYVCVQVCVNVGVELCEYIGVNRFVWMPILALLEDWCACVCKILYVLRVLYMSFICLEGSVHVINMS